MEIDGISVKKKDLKCPFCNCQMSQFSESIWDCLKKNCGQSTFLFYFGKVNLLIRKDQFHEAHFRIDGKDSVEECVRFLKLRAFE